MPDPISVGRPIDVVVNSPKFADVRVYQPYEFLQKIGWDVRFHYPPFDLNHVRQRSLLIWQRPLNDSPDEWLEAVDCLRGMGCLVVVEWDDHPDLFIPSVRSRIERSKYLHLRYCHALQVSTSGLANALKIFNPNIFVVENAVHPIPPLKVHRQNDLSRIFLGNFNREREQRMLAADLNEWLQEPGSPILVTVGPSGLEDALPPQKVESYPPLNYSEYRSLMATCDVALLPLQQGLPQSCKTPIKWMEAAAESVAVVGGPELYGPWLASGEFGLYAQTIKEIIPMARWLVDNPRERQAMVQRAYNRIDDFSLEQQTKWRIHLYSHLERYFDSLDESLLNRFNRNVKTG